MSAALMRNCPKCKKPFIKESGCNKITCYNCLTISCYVCRQSIVGYDHFNQNRGPGTASTSETSKKCPLWEPVENRHAEEVKAAAEKAIADYRAEHPDIDTEEMKVDVPKAPPPPPPPQLNVPQVGFGNPFPNALGLQIQINPMPLINPPPAPAPAPPRGRVRGRRRAQPAPPIPAAPAIQPIPQLQGAVAAPFMPAFQALPNFQPLLVHRQLLPPPPPLLPPGAVGVPQVQQGFGFHFNPPANVNPNPVPVQNPPGRRRGRR